MAQENPSSFFKKLLQRRVFQIVGIYLGAIVALMEFTGIVVERYGVSDNIVDLVLAGMISFIPAVIVLAWSHGAPGRDDWGKLEKSTIPINLIVTLTLISYLTLNSSSSVDQQQQTVQVSAEQKVTISAEQTAFKRIGVFFVDQEGDIPEELKWLSYGLSYLISEHLSQDINLRASSFYENIEHSPFWQLKRSGFKDGLNVPLSLAKTVAIDSDYEYFTSAKFSVEKDVINLSLKLMETKTSNVLAEISTSGNTIFDLVESITVFLKQLPELRTEAGTQINQIPLTELTSTNQQAIKLYIESLNLILFNNDYALSVKGIKKTIETDPSFALAHLQLAELLIKSGSIDESKAHLQKALSYSYKLDRRRVFMAKAASYVVSQNILEVIQVYRSWIDISPNDYLPYYQLATQLVWQGENNEEAIELFKKSLSLNPSQNWIYNRLAELYKLQGEFEKAKTHYRKYFELRPTTFMPLVEIGHIEMSQGNFDLARKEYKKAALLRTDKVTPQLALANLSFREGELKDVESHFLEAEVISQAPRQNGLILNHKIGYFYQLGRIEEAFQLLLEYQQVITQYETIVNSAFASKLTQMYLYVESGNKERALSDLKSLEKGFDKTFKPLAEFGYLFLYLASNDIEKAERSLEEVRQLIEKFQLGHLAQLEYFSMGIIAKENGKLELAEEYLIKALAEHKNSPVRDATLSSEIGNVLVLSSLLRENKKLNESVKVAKDFLTKWPKHPGVNFELAKTYKVLGLIGEAKSHLDIALEMWEQSDINCKPCQEAKKFKLY